MSAMAMSGVGGEAAAMGGGGGTPGTNGSGGGEAGKERPNRPKPLDLQGPFPLSLPLHTQPRPPPGDPNGNEPSMPMEDVLALMAQIQTAVKNGALDPALANLVFRLYHQLKLQGPALEATHKAEMSRVFVSLRQACCRDSGQLGTPCRLKIMELVELRAMGWRPNLAHSQYYHHQPPSSTPPNTGSAPPVSAPPFGSVPINPFGFPVPAQPQPPPPPHPILSHQPAHFHSIADLQGIQMLPATTGIPGARPSYYLVPTQTFHPFLPPAPATAAAPLHFPAPPQAVPVSQPLPQPPLPPPQPVSQPQQSSPSSQAANTPSDWPRGAVVRPSSKLPNPQRVPGKNQFRDEIVIRNADSGKIMGVKGRRVAVVESLTKTVISFQKVASGAKERTLTLTANSEEELAYAKKLIEETIRRNVSPNRADDGTELEAGEAWSADAAAPLSVIESGLLRLHCDDPEMLAAAQEALADYFSRSAPMRRSQNSIRSPAEMELRRERRKSMPSFSPDAQRPADAHQDWRRPFLPPTSRATTNSPAAAPAKLNHAGANAMAASSGQAKSTPDLSASAPSTPATNSKARLGIRAVYTKDFLLQKTASPLARCSPGNLAHINAEAPEILRASPGLFSPAEYEEMRAIAAAAPAPGLSQSQP